VFWPLKSSSEFLGVLKDSTFTPLGGWVSSSHLIQSGVATQLLFPSPYFCVFFFAYLSICFAIPNTFMLLQKQRQNVKVGNSQEGWSSPSSSFLSPCFHLICGLSICFVVTITMFVLFCKNKDERFMLTTIRRTSREHKLFWIFFCIPNLYVRIFVTIAIVLQLGRPKLSRLFFASLVYLFACMSPSPLFYN